jgi:hypothetical protein
MRSTGEGSNCLVWADPAAGGGQGELRRQEGWTGWLACPAPFFVEPSSPHRSHPTRRAIVEYEMGATNGPLVHIGRYRGFSTVFSYLSEGTKVCG